jgi:hypothetical protein
MDIHIPGVAKLKPLELEVRIGEAETSGGLRPQDLLDLFEWAEVMLAIKGAPDAQKNLNRIDDFRSAIHHRYGGKSCDHGPGCPYPASLLAKRLLKV